MPSEHTLYIVATPIGHRSDLSIRAVDVLKRVSRIYAEDTRHSLPLMQHHGIGTRLTALHEHNESARVSVVIEYLNTVGSAALITDAGTPLISDPGFRLVRACHEAGIRVSPVPGPCAVTAALSVSGLPTDRFLFAGFAPSRRGARKRWFESLAFEAQTLVLYESPHRIVESLEDLADVVGPDRQVTVARELTKRFETLIRGSITEVLQLVRSDANQQRGEFVVLIASADFSATVARASGSERSGDDSDAALSPDSSEPNSQNEGRVGHTPVDLDSLIRLMLEHQPVKRVARQVADLTGLPRKTIYARALEVQGR